MPQTLEPVLLIFAAILLVVLLLLVIPVTISFSIVRRGAFTGGITIGWLFGLLQYTPSLAVSSDSSRRRRTRKAPADPGETPSEASGVSAKRFMKLLKSKGFIRGALRFLRNVAGCVRFVSLHVAGRFGLDNPYDTGRLWGNLCAFTGFLHGAERVRILVEPEFNEAVFELDSRGVIRIVPVTLLLPAARFVLSPSTLRAAWTASRRPE